MAAKAASTISLNTVLAADTTLSTLKIHEYANYALAGATPIAILSSKGSLMLKAADMVLAFAIPAHMHITTCTMVSDYLPRAARGPARFAALGISAVTFLGLTKLNFFGHGITESVRGLWRRPPVDKSMEVPKKKGHWVH